MSTKKEAERSSTIYDDKTELRTGLSEQGHAVDRALDETSWQDILQIKYGFLIEPTKRQRLRKDRINGQNRAECTKVFTSSELNTYVGHSMLARLNYWIRVFTLLI
jgi:hypothetical protein